jgi:hypothetical protein
MIVMAFRNSPVGKRGYAWLEIDAAVPEGVTFSLCNLSRSSEPYLGPNGWRVNPYHWKPLLIDRGPPVRLQVGPQIVDRLHPDVQIRIDIPSVEYSAETVWEYVLPSGAPLPEVKEEEPLQPPPEPVRPEPVKPPPEPVRQPTPPPEPVRQPTPPPEPVRRPTPPPEPVVRQPPPPPKPEPVRQQPQTPEPEKSSRMIAVAALLAGAVIGLPVGYLYIDAERVAASPPAASASGAASPDGAIQLLASNRPPPEQLYQAAIALRESPGGSRDIALQAMRRAEQLRYAPAMLWLAQAVDPSRQDWKDASMEPDAARALAGYAKAEQAGSSDAATLHTALCGYMRVASRITDAEREAVTRYCR